MLPQTILLYLRQPDLIEQRARILACRDLPDGGFAFSTDVTVFYPASGGQPSDVGKVLTVDSTSAAHVERVTVTDGIVEHIARPLRGSFAIGDEIAMIIDRSVRATHSRLHSAGELICCAVRNIGRSWSVASASHHPGQARVVYDVALSEPARQALQVNLAAELDGLLRRGGAVRIQEVDDRVEAARLIGFNPDYVPAGQPVRIVFMSDGLGRPCCGTHVADVRDIGRILIRNIRSKKGQTSIGYDITTETHT